MIRYSLTCSAGHAFESWFQSADAFETLAGSGHLVCAVCGGSDITKSLMAPAVRPARNQRGRSVEQPAEDRPLTTPANPMEEAMAALRRQVEQNSDYVGLNFAAEARRIHDGDAPLRSIYGEAKPDEARQLIEDGVPVAPLPFMPVRKTN